MDYLGNHCPVCEKPFHADDDIVVCPDCGTPHHRACYEAVGHCANADRHEEGYDFAEDDSNVNSGVVICRSCGKENEKGTFFCKYCSAPLSKEDERSDTSQQEGVNGIPFRNGVPVYMDPLGGVPADTDMGDGVTAGEIAKYVKQNTPYFVRVFQNLKEFNRTRFSFVGLLFGGGYLLYRKMYKIGAILTVLQAAMTITTVFIQQSTVYQDFWKASTSQSSSIGQLLDYFAKLSTADKFILYLPMILWVVNLVVHIVIGVAANRLYFKHCRQQIVRIKSSVKAGENAETLLQTKGGVNMPLAFSLLITNMLINYLPGIIQGMS